MNAYISNVDADTEYKHRGKGCLCIYPPDELVTSMAKMQNTALAPKLHPEGSLSVSKATWLSPIFHKDFITLVREPNGASQLCAYGEGFHRVQFYHLRHRAAVETLPKFGKSPTRFEVSSDLSRVKVYLPRKDQQRVIIRRKRRIKLPGEEIPGKTEPELQQPTWTYLPISSGGQVTLMAEVGTGTKVFSLPAGSYESFFKLFGKYELEI